MRLAAIVFHSVAQTLAIAVTTRFGPFRGWPRTALLLEEPLALAEERTSRLRRIHSHAGRDAWDGPTLFREAVARHGGIQLEPGKRVALARVLSILLWGELAAWIVAAELAEGLDDLDARMAASAQAFDEARHFYVLRDYVALLHVPMPPLDPYFTAGARRVLKSRDLALKLIAIQLLAEGGATSIFRILLDTKVEPVLSELLPYIERDEARHVGLGVMHLPGLLRSLPRRRLRRLRRQGLGAANLIGAANLRNADAYRALGIDPRRVMRETDKVVSELIRKLGSPDARGEPFLPTVDVESPSYARSLEVLVPEPGARLRGIPRAAQAVLRAGARLLPG